MLLAGKYFIFQSVHIVIFRVLYIIAVVLLLFTNWLFSQNWLHFHRLNAIIWGILQFHHSSNQMLKVILYTSSYKLCKFLLNWFILFQTRSTKQVRESYHDVFEECVPLKCKLSKSTPIKFFLKDFASVLNIFKIKSQ